jgi:sugar lactone lactonase YvrE
MAWLWTPRQPVHCGWQQPHPQGGNQRDYHHGGGQRDNGYSGDGGAATNAAELRSPNGVAVDATGNLFIADSYNNRIRKVGTNGIITTVAGNGYGERLLRRRGRGDQC